MGSSPVPELEKHEVAVDAASAGVRLDRVLASALPALSRMRVKALIQAGLVSRDGATISEPSNRVKPGETYAVVVPPAADPTPQGQNIPLHIVYEDDDLIVVDAQRKPVGLIDSQDLPKLKLA